ncbi:hypothetical protein L873DRAFT_503627 [Choiromyces venosus 120613-1]|uniref:Uncharacterized protein n=1 Tax=Choiromyces venosus 120613-1 TaxID=1336337 RepID=A0A3N4J8C0_9PEZI|nr:hypothetical protein L873DRAFT_503627 [Choiromyces venosus 120613-1]
MQLKSMIMILMRILQLRLSSSQRLPIPGYQLVFMKGKIEFSFSFILFGILLCFSFLL